MKFGKLFKKQQVPEWSEAYTDYAGFKKMLKEMKMLKPRTLNPEPFYSTFSGLICHAARDIQSSADVEEQGRESDVSQQDHVITSPERDFFSKLDDDTRKVNAFYRDKVVEVKKEAALLTRQMNALVALRIKVRKLDLEGMRVDLQEPASSVSEFTYAEFTYAEEVDVVADGPAQLEVLDHVKIRRTSGNPVLAIKGILKDSKDKKSSFEKDELKDVEKRLKHAFVEFYHKLQLLQNYSYVNLLAFSKTLKKYDKIESKHVSRSYMKHVDDSYLGSCNEVIRLLEKVEAIYIKHFPNSDRKEGMKLLRPKPKGEKHRITFFVGFLSGCSTCWK